MHEERRVQNGFSKGQKQFYYCMTYSSECYTDKRSSTPRVTFVTLFSYKSGELFTFLSFRSVGKKGASKFKFEGLGWKRHMV